MHAGRGSADLPPRRQVVKHELLFRVPEKRVGTFAGASLGLGLLGARARAFGDMERRER